MGLPETFKTEWRQVKATIAEFRAMLADLSARIAALEAKVDQRKGGGY